MTWHTIPTVSDNDFIDMPFWRKVWDNLLHLKNKIGVVKRAANSTTNVTITSTTFVDIHASHYHLEFEAKGDRPVLLSAAIRWSDSVHDNASIGATNFTVDGVAVSAATNGLGFFGTTIGDSLGEMRVFSWIAYNLSEGAHDFVVQAKQLTGSTGNLIILLNNATPMMWAIEL